MEELASLLSQDPNLMLDQVTTRQAASGGRRRGEGRKIPSEMVGSLISHNFQGTTT